MTARTITCADCGQEYETKRKNTKLCRFCRTISNFKFVGDRTETCALCGELFAPVRRMKQNWLVCMKCERPWQKDTEGDCAVCGQHSEQLYDPDIAVCRKCIQSPSQRLRILRALLEKQKERMAS